MIIELHLLQSFPVSNLNRDDMGQPKTATFGGVPRGRISSQCLKRSARQLFGKNGLREDETGVRTKRLLHQAAVTFVEKGYTEEDARLIVEEGLATLGFGIDRSTQLTEYLLFVGREASSFLAQYCIDRQSELEVKVTERKDAAAKATQKKTTAKDGAKPAVKAAKTKPSKEQVAAASHILDARKVADIALFGRMIADNKGFNVDAASQVAHAISTHAVATEFDYYTAVDDEKPEDSAGADMIGTVDFNSACYYRYANVDLGQLLKNLDGDADLLARTASAWLHAFVQARPSGKQNSMAALTMPHTMLGVVRDAGSWNLANAFLKPVDSLDVMTDSTELLLRHFDSLRSFYGDAGIQSVTAATVSGDLPHIDPAEAVPSMAEFANRVLTTAGVASREQDPTAVPAP
ncbi:type I-E CRISPR-associated protein Cas7/Cse4/CasC [Actinoalloteichus hymeniacidonis]|uniref:CRISPR-associated protein Cas7/Cse4/CasC, subtype I-E/ECOLI n=1 Tax=Actinoalloteichus hymeniacidonis TaxID=340345 RepID=A0AAC9N073_9PSEU|nr:type I-E CRISPR-associated protein Cas7/Cse4/CasC [Actinoalloteichus hymeniacidonis]AOS64802.1 CRISPR-associated protein Cas7/Cse4/CasC, subtype I-E/ECOLI [Actinoalloteichus hymeniacidonis]MBB5907124.1 CRISPR system Cascade subunit CasC [Actinoalloteichus hymeniacidonis]